MRKILAALAAALAALTAMPALAQGVGGGVFQSGPVTPGDVTTWKSAGVIQDGGAPPGGGTVTSVGLSLPGEFSCSGSPIVGAGVITCGWVSQTANKVFAAPNGAPGTPAFRLLVAADIPALSYVTSVSSANGDLTVGTPTTTPLLTVISAPKWDTGRTLSITGDLAYTSPSFNGTANVTAVGTIQANVVTVAKMAQAAANTVLGNFTAGTANQAANAVPLCTDTGGNHLNYTSGAGLSCGTSDSHGGTVTSVAQTVPSILTIAGSPITTAGTLALDLATQSANLIFAGPTSGAAAQPTFRGMVAADCPAGTLCPDTVGGGLQLNGAALQAVSGIGPRLTPGVTTLTLANTDCGSDVLSNSAGGALVVTLPSAPPTSCRFNFFPITNSITLSPNGKNINTFSVAYSTALLIPALANNGGTLNPGQMRPFVLEFDGTVWYLTNGPGPGLENVAALAGGDPLATHGQVYLSLTGSTLQLCPYNGPGGLIVGHYMTLIPPCNGSTSFGAQLPNTATTGSSVLNYIYAVQISAAITSADNTSCNGRLTVGNETGMQPNDTITINNLANTTEANGVFLIASIPDATHICLAGITFTHTGADAGNILGVGLIASATGHVTDTASVTNGANDGVEVLSTNGRRTLVGIVYVGAAQALNDSATNRDVLSWFNRQPKKLIVQVSGSAPTVAASTGVGTFKTLSTVIEGEFVIASPPSLPGSVPTNSAEWHVLSLVLDGGNVGVCALGSTFNTSAQSGNAAVTGELEVAAAVLGVTVTDQSDTLHASGLATGLSEGRQFIDIAGWNTATNPCSLSGGLMPITLEAIVWQ